VRHGLLLTLAALLLLAAPWQADAGTRPARKIVLVGMKRDHGAGEHEYMAGLAILAECLKQTPGTDVVIVKVDFGDKGLPEELAKEIEGAHCIVTFLRAGGTYFMNNAERKAKLQEVLKKGAGFVALHWAVEGEKKFGDDFMPILGGYYEPGFSKNPHNTTKVENVDPKSPVGRGWDTFEARDEFYFKIRLLPEAKAVVKATLMDRDKDKTVYKDETIAWTYERKDSKGILGAGRSFGFTGCHFHQNFGTPEFRRLIVNGILWTAGFEVPEGGAPVMLKGPVPKVPEESK
jgi:type 1 glutamine amidotransferase